jgi:hypothetical protein
MAKKTNLPTWSKGVIAVVITGATAFALYKIYKLIQANLDQKKGREEMSATDRKLRELERAGKGAKLSQPQILQLANKLETAFGGYGTDFGAIKNAIQQITNEADLLSVRKAYDIRTISSGDFNPASDYTGTLDQTITDECDSSQIAILNDILKAKQINDLF